MSVASVLASFQHAAAHCAWVDERWGELAVIYGHGPGDDPYDSSKVTSVKAVGEDGKRLL